MDEIKDLLTFTIYGKFAHFRKFYTNASSLSYSLPPRTAIIGMLASVLGIARDGYYDEFSPEKIKISVLIKHPGKKITQSLNYLHNDYYKLLVSGKGKVQHSQCKLELLIGKDNKPIEYKIIVGATDKGKEIFDKLTESLKKEEFGYGIYFGQRQFKAYLDNIQNESIEAVGESEVLHSICLKENVVKLDTTEDTLVVSEQMPIHMENTNPGRKASIVKRVIFEQNGKELQGKFKNCYKVGKEIISFFGG